MILVFSGTGNSLAVAREISRLSGDVIEMIRPGRVIAPGRGLVIWVFPVYSWGLPPIVSDFIKAQPNLGGRRHCCVFTCGDDVGMADRSWRTAMKRAGADDLRAVCSVQMPNTYVCLPGFDVDSSQLSHAKLDAMPGTVARIYDVIISGERTTDVVRGRFPWVKTKLIYPLFRRFMMSPRQFHVTQACTVCGKCARSCPLGNITMDGGADSRHPHWHDRCTLCLRCYHICPHHAIAYGKSTADKGQKNVRL